jgi:hypothetical protein
VAKKKGQSRKTARSSASPARPTPRRAVTPPQPAARPLDARQTTLMRELFWQNVIREILTSLSGVAALRGPSEPQSRELVQQASSDQPDDAQAPAGLETIPEAPHPRPQEEYQPELFDGRLAVILKNGERVPIADVFPLFACSLNTPVNRPLAVAVECSVFQIRTPQGQVFTVPLHEIRGFHALTPELIDRIASAARKQQRRPEMPEDMPFGFAAFTSLARGTQPFIVPQAPDYPTE